MTKKEILISAIVLFNGEFEYIYDCLNSLVDFVDEIILVCNTDLNVNDCREIQNTFGGDLKIIVRIWTDNFSVARNAGAEEATGKWILMIDPDERLVFPKPLSLNGKELGDDWTELVIKVSKEMLNSDENRTGAYINAIISRMVDSTEAHVIDYRVRLYRNRKNIEWKGAVFEQIDESLGENEIQVEMLPIFTIDHIGWMNFTTNSKRFEYYMKILTSAIENGGTWRDHIERAMLHQKLGMHLMAEFDFLNAQKLIPNNSPFKAYLLNSGALIYYGVKNFGRMEELLMASINADKNQYFPFILLGDSIVMTGKYDYAAEFYATALQRYHLLAQARKLPVHFIEMPEVIIRKINICKQKFNPAYIQQNGVGDLYTGQNFRKSN